MNDTNIGSEESRKPLNAIDPGYFGAIPEPVNLNQVYTSTIEPSEQQELRIGVAAGIPVLPAPVVDQMVNSFKLQMAEISSEVLKAWSKSIEEQAALVRKWINSSGYLARQEEIQKIASGKTKELSVADAGGALDYADSDLSPESTAGKIEQGLVDKYSWLISLGVVLATALQIKEAQELQFSSGVKGVAGSTGVSNAPGAFGLQNSRGVQDSQGVVVGVRVDDVDQEQISPVGQPSKGVESTDRLDQNRNSSTSQFLSQGLLIAASEILLIQSAVPLAGVALANTMHAEAILLQNAWKSLSMGVNDFATQVGGWFSALWGIGLIYQTSAESLNPKGVEVGKSELSRDIDFAKKYAQKILLAVHDPLFAASLLSAVEKSAPKELAKAQIPLPELVVKAKLVLLSLALALLAKLEVGSRKDEGWINELDFIGLLTGKTDLDQNDLYETAGTKRALIGEIQQLLSSLPPTVREGVLYNLIAYMSTNPPVEEMLDQQRAFEKIFNQRSFENGVFHQRPID